jgi:NADPH:quinone reductase-like Zn-dependent oxidoreductase
MLLHQSHGTLTDLRGKLVVLVLAHGSILSRIEASSKPGSIHSGAEEAEKLGVTVSTTQVRSSGEQLGQLANLLDTGAIRVAIDSTFALANAQKAHERAAQGHIRGKIVLLVIGQE